MRLFAFILCVCSLFFCSSVFAQTEAIPLEYRGAQGVWLPLDMARDALAARTNLENAATEMRILNEQLTLKRQTIAELNRVLSLSAVVERDLNGALLVALQKRADAEASRDAWYRAPWLWFSLGVIGTAGVIFALLF